MDSFQGSDRQEGFDGQGRRTALSDSEGGGVGGDDVSADQWRARDTGKELTCSGICGRPFLPGRRSRTLMPYARQVLPSSSLICRLFLIRPVTAHQYRPRSSRGAGPASEKCSRSLLLIYAPTHPSALLPPRKYSAFTTAGSLFLSHISWRRVLIIN